MNPELQRRYWCLSVDDYDGRNHELAEQFIGTHAEAEREAERLCEKWCDETGELGAILRLDSRGVVAPAAAPGLFGDRT